MHNRLEKEKAFHNEAFSTGIRKPLDAYYSIFETIREDFKERLTVFVRTKAILEVGCGVNSYAHALAPLTNHMHGIDISEEAVRQSDEMAKDKQLPNCQFDVMNAENTTFTDNSFDLLFGVGIIHHLNLPVFYAEASRILKPTGSMLFMEPLGYHPLINLYRKLTPKMRTPDEHPLLRKDILLISKYFKEVHVKYYHFFTLLAVPLRNTRIFKPLLRLLESMDRCIFKWIPGFKYLAWYCIIEAHTPLK